ncbi:MAG TPA: hypothetical protein VLH79_13490, partial [Chthonomonadales bacterium]|nr:hypothetical protein [Chthonomonadales bacterium]
RWTTALAPSVIGWWWGFWLIDNWMSIAALGALVRADSVVELQTALVGHAASHVTGVISALTAIAMVKAVHAAQCATVERGG